MRHLKIHFLVLVVCTLSSLHAGTHEWPAFRGPDGQGVSTARNVPADWGPGKNVAWKTEIPGRGWSSPLLIDGKIVLTTGMDEPVDGRHALKVLQVDAGSGKTLWEKTVLHATEAEAKDKHPKNSLASPTPAIEDGVIYAHFGHMGTVALDFETGGILWKQKISYKSANGAGGSPVVVGDLLVFTTDSREEPVITALYKDTGKIAWRTTRSHQVKNHFSFGTPLVIENAGRTEIVSAGSGMIGGYEPETGKELWRVTYPMGFSISNRPVFADGMLYFSTGFQRPTFLAVRLDGATGDLTDTHVVWEYRKSMPKTPSPNFVNGSVITLEDDGRLQSFDARTGEHQWLENLKGKFAASPVQVGDRLYCINEEGLCYILRVSDKACEILNEIDMGEQALASPAIVDNTIYLRTHPHLWKIAH